MLAPFGDGRNGTTPPRDGGRRNPWRGERARGRRSGALSRLPLVVAHFRAQLFDLLLELADLLTKVGLRGAVVPRLVAIHPRPLSWFRESERPGLGRVRAAQVGLDLAPVAAAEQREVDGAVLRGQRLHELVRRIDVVAADLEDHVAGADAGLLRGRVLEHLRDEHAVFAFDAERLPEIVVQLLDAHAQPAARHAGGEHHRATRARPAAHAGHAPQFLQAL